MKKIVTILVAAFLVGCNSSDFSTGGGAEVSQSQSLASPSASALPLSPSPTPTPTPNPTHFLYVTNTTDDTISEFGVSPDGTGQLLPVSGTVSTGHGPTELKVSPSKKFLYCLNPTSSTLSQYSIDPSSGRLSPLTSRDIGVGTSSQFLSFDSSGYLWIRVSSGPQFLKYSVGTTGQLTYVGTFVSSPASFGSAYALSFGAYVYNVNSSTNMIDVYNLSPMTLTPYSYSAGRNITSLAVY